MEVNRIRRYDPLWSTPKNLRERSEDLIPPGFGIMSLNGMTIEQRQEIEKCKALYDWAYREALRKVDNDFFGDWVI